MRVYGRRLFETALDREQSGGGHLDEFVTDLLGLARRHPKVGCKAPPRF
jgi:hypothetical protein